MKVFHFLQVWLTLTLISFSTGARILAVAPIALRSHQIFIQTVLKELALKGHQVVSYSPFPQHHPVPNYTDVQVNTNFSENVIDYEMLLASFESSKTNAAHKRLWLFLHRFEVEALQNKNIQKLAKSEEKFDLVITESFITQEAFLALGHKFNAPTIAIQSVFSFCVTDKVMGNSLALSYIPDWSFDMSDKMSFKEKLTNIYSAVNVLFSFYNEHIPAQQALVDQYLNFPNAPPLSDMIHNISLVLFNHHPTNNYPRPFPPNFIPLGGIHVSADRKPLPQDIQVFMDEAKHGVIYFSLGTVVPENQLPLDFYTKFIRVFEKLKQKVLWKTKRDDIPGIPDNVMIVKWAPQQDILAHSNCALFITHGGLLSQQEVISAGVPVVAIPFFGDQPFNVRFYEEKGVGVKLNFLTLSEKSIFTALNTVLSNPSFDLDIPYCVKLLDRSEWVQGEPICTVKRIIWYTDGSKKGHWYRGRNIQCKTENLQKQKFRYKANALQLSKIVHDVPMSQAESAVYWVEYVLRHQGAQHLRPASAHMPWYQLALLDVLALILLVTVTTIVTICWLFWRILQWLHKNKRQTDLREKND